MVATSQLRKSARQWTTAPEVPPTVSALEEIASPSDLDFLGEFDRVVDLDAKVTNGAFDLGVAEQ